MSMIVQAVDTGSDSGENQFELAIPGSGVGLLNACTTEWGAPKSGWGAQYGGMDYREGRDSLPDSLRGGCYWRFDWLRNADNPQVNFEKISCPIDPTDITGCRRADDPVPIQSSSPTLATSSSTPTSSSQVGLYEQCGGRTYNGPTDCKEGQCTFVDDYYYQCLLPWQTPSTSPTLSRTAIHSTSSTVTFAKPIATIAQIYEQCGGHDWTGPTRCAEVCAKTTTNANIQIRLHPLLLFTLLSAYLGD